MKDLEIVDVVVLEIVPGIAVRQVHLQVEEVVGNMEEDVPLLAVLFLPRPRDLDNLLHLRRDHHLGGLHRHMDHTLLLTLVHHHILPGMYSLLGNAFINPFCIQMNGKHLSRNKNCVYSYFLSIPLFDGRNVSGHVVFQRAGEFFLHNCMRNDVRL